MRNRTIATSAPVRAATQAEPPPADRLNVRLKTAVMILALFAIAGEIGAMFDSAHVQAARPAERVASAPASGDATGALAIKRRDLKFRDEADGGVLITDAASGTVVHRIAPGTEGFTRALMRGLARDRRTSGVGSEVPFTLSELADGRLQLVDPATRRVVVLNAFGPTNAGAFAGLL
ncbi:MAG: photosynthetic complex assembly protein PuhC [Lautropia sp.]